MALWDNYFLPTLLLLVPLHQRAKMQLATAAKNVNETNLKAKAKNLTESNTGHTCAVAKKKYNNSNNNKTTTTALKQLQQLGFKC